MDKCDVNNLDVQRFSFLLLLFIITALSLPTDALARDKRYPGELVSLGTHRLHIHCVGHGSPSVIIDSGIGGFSLEWIKVQNNLADDVRVCSYDRAGYGWSDPGPRPRTTERITSELRRLLTEARIPGPYVLVGHSFGGYNIRYFASKFPGLTAGLVLIDSSHPEQFNTEEFKRIEPKYPTREAIKYKKSYKVRIVHPIISDNYPSENKLLAFNLMSSMKSKSTLINELDNMEISAHQVAAQTDHPPYTFPVIIITRGKRVWPQNDLGNRREQQWLRLQNDLQNISMQSRHYLAEDSGHIIHLDQPEFVSNNILSAVTKVKTQIHEQELIKKFDIRFPAYAAIPSFRKDNKSFLYDADTSNENSILNKSIHQVMFDNKLRHFGNHSTYFLR